MGIAIGTSGWSYDHWTNVLYPEGLPARDRLEYYARAFRSVELNASFYRWPRESAFASWQRRLPDGFQLSVKAPRGLTHGKKLYEPEVWIERIERGWHELGDKRAVLQVQLPPTMERDDARLDYFLGALPPWIRVAVELRHASWDHGDVYRLLERHNAAYVVMSGAGLPCVLRVTSDIAYVRMHGPSDDHLYSGSYSDADLNWWADRIDEWDHGGTRVYVYFNNDGDGHAVRNAQRLIDILVQRGLNVDIAEPSEILHQVHNFRA
ncbi:DUF72 domain-containing protein [soil metagenome]